MEDFLKQLGITQKGNYSDDGCYVLDLDEKTFFKYESILDKSDLVDLDDEFSNISYETISKIYESDYYEIALIADEYDNYRLSIKED